MKKNVLRILLALVLVAFVFAFAACGGGDDKNVDNSDKKKHVAPKDCIDEDGNGLCDICKKKVESSENKLDLTAELTNLLKALNPYLAAFKDTKKDSTLGMDIAVGGYYENAKDSAKKGDFKLNLAANARAKKPELKVGVSVNSVEYFVLGYKDAALYLLEGLNLINSDDAKATAVRMNANYLSGELESAAGVGMEYLAWLAGSKTLAKLNLEDLATSDGFTKLIGAVGNLITATVDEKDAKIVKFTIGSDKVARLIPMVITMVAEDGNPDPIIETIDSVLGYVNKIFKLEGDKELSYSKILDTYLPELVIKGRYDSTDAEKRKLVGLDVAITIDALDLEFGLAIDLNTLDLGKTASISFGSDYTAKDLVSTVTLDLPVKGAYGKLDLAVNTSSAFSSETATIASAKLGLKNKDAAAGANYTEIAKAAFDGKDIYLGIKDAAYTMLDGEAPTDLDFIHTIEVAVKDDDGKPVKDAKGIVQTEAKNIKTMLKEALAGLKYTEPEESDEEESSGSSDKDKDKDKDEPGLIDSIILELDKKVGKFLKFDLVKDGKALAIGDIIKQITDKFNEKGVGDILVGEGATAGKIDKVKKQAGIQLLGSTADEPSLLKFVANFIRIGKVNADHTGWVEGEFSEIDSVDTLTDLILLGFYNLSKDANAEDGDFVATVEMVKQIVGISYQQILADGIYAYAGYNEKAGLSGYIGLRSDIDESKGEKYLEIGASIAFAGATSHASIPANTTGMAPFAQMVIDEENGKELTVGENTIKVEVDSKGYIKYEMGSELNTALTTLRDVALDYNIEVAA